MHLANNDLIAWRAGPGKFYKTCFKAIHWSNIYWEALLWLLNFKTRVNFDNILHCINK